MDLARIVQVALLGEVPPSLRYLYAYLEGKTLHYHAVFTSDAEDIHLECANVVLAEVTAACPLDIEVMDIIEKDSDKPWRQGDGTNLLYLRYGELEGY